MPVEAEFIEILTVLDHHEVEFVVCGGIAAVLHGAPIMTLDLDLLFEPSEANCRRMAPALLELEAIYFDVALASNRPPTRAARPTSEAVAAPGRR